MDRRDWPIAVYKLGEEPGDDLSQVTTAAQRLEMMWPLAKEAWLLSGRAIPDYRREDAPGRVIRQPPRGEGREHAPGTVEEDPTNVPDTRSR